MHNFLPKRKSLQGRTGIPRKLGRGEASCELAIFTIAKRTASKEAVRTPLGRANRAHLGDATTSVSQGPAVGPASTGASQGLAVGTASTGASQGLAVGTASEGLPQGTALGTASRQVSRGPVLRQGL
jgi:hypothetical protein